jgi:hypothetical protein
VGGATPRLEAIDATNWRGFVASPLAVLVLGKTDCPNCARWTEELGTFLEADREFADVRFGKMLLDRPGLGDFKRANPWLADLDVLPYTLLYRGGEKAKEFAGGGIERLVNRLRGLRG